MTLVKKQLQIVENDKYKMSYWVQVPKVVSENMPILVFMHGYGGHIKLNAATSDDGQFDLNAFVDSTYDYPFIVIQPMLPSDDRGNYTVKGWVDIADLVVKAIDNTLEQYKADIDRVYLSGFSMGGRGTWNVAALYPDRFAALAPSGWYCEVDIAPKLVHVPIWTFNGANDEICNILGVERVIKVFKDAGGTINYTIYSGAHAVEDETLSEGTLRWLLKHNRKDNAIYFKERLRQKELKKAKLDAAPRCDAMFGTPDMTQALDQLWDNVKATTINKNSLSGDFKLLWDNEYLYVSCYCKNIGENEKDSVEVFIESDNKKSSIYGFECAHYTLNMKNEYTVATPAENKGILKSRIVKQNQGYIFEIAIPLKKSCEFVGFDIYINTYDRDDNRYVCTWSDNENLAWTDPSVFGIVKLLD